MRRSRGFTLVELMVSLVAGLLVSIAVIALAKTATIAFHEQARVMASEQAVRSAAERLRSDLARASYMGPGNSRVSCFSQSATCNMAGRTIPHGHRMAYVPGTDPLRYPGQATLQGVRVGVGGSMAITNANGHSGTNGLNPDEIFLAGNFTTDDAYIGRVIGAGACGGPRIQLTALEDPAVGRLLNNAPDQATAQIYVRNAFTPVAGSRFFARVVDSQGCNHYVHVQNALAQAANVAWIDVCTDINGGAILTRQEPGAGGTGSVTCGWQGTAVTQPDPDPVLVSPLHRVRWYVGPNTEARLAQLSGTGPANSQFNLYRQLLDAEGNVIGTPPTPLPEVIAEFAVDLKFGVVVDADPVVPAPNNIVVYDMDVAGPDVTLWTQASNLTNPLGPGPQRVRSVRFRLATRAAIPDRRAQITFAPPIAPVLARYCVDPPACLQYSRVRTIISEVALFNQARMTY